ncbi:MAG: hypothetical protein HFG91_02010 [Acholeplasmatales bacterium]|jgi:hypothetical protein|nr:hypothetical protein [Acholeplasmatales bacterium]MCI9653112.1 hypothetical protein [Acholeplasmatales bacterium]
MLNTRRLAKEIYALNEEMKQLESKRARSMASILESLISRTEPNQTEVQFFRTYTAQIDIKREQLQKLTKQLEREI